MRNPGGLGKCVYIGLSCQGVLASLEGNVEDLSIKKLYQHHKQKQAALRGKWKSAPLVPYWVELLLGDVQHIWNVWLPGRYLHQRADCVIDEYVDKPMSRTRNRPVPITYDTVPSSLNS